jgi:hypothetical protein
MTAKARSVQSEEIQTSLHILHHQFSLFFETQDRLYRPTDITDGHVAELVGIEGGVVSGIINLESSGA